MKMRSEETVKDVGMRELTLNSISIVKGEYGGGFSAVEYDPKKPRYIRITDINDEGELNQNVVAPSGTDTDWNKYALSYGDLLFARSGATVGKTFLYDKQYGNCIYAGYLIRFRINQEIAFPKFIYYFTKSTKYNAWVKSKQNVVAQPNINAQQYGNELKIPLPSLSEQKRIAELLDAADNLRKKDKALLEKYDQLAQSLFLEMFGDPVKYKKEKLGSFIKLIGGGTPSKDVESYWNGDIPWASVKDLKSDYLINTQDYITEQGLKNSVTKIIPSGSLIIATRMAVGKTVVCKQNTAINQDLKGIQINGAINEIYLLHLFKSNETYFQSVASGATVKGIKIEHITDLEIPIPPISLQNQFAEQVQLKEKQKEIAKQNLEKSEELMKGLMGRVFG